MLVTLDPSRVGRARPPAVLLGGGLSLVRALGVAGIPTVVATSRAGSPELASRYVCGWCKLPPASAPDAARLDALMAAARALERHTGSRPPLYYGNDDELAFVHRHADVLRTGFLLLLNEPELAASLMDKGRFLSLARSRNVPVPRTYFWTGADLDGLGTAEGPLIVKPLTTSGLEGSELASEVFGRAKALVFPSAAALVEHPLCRKYSEHLLVQEYIPGDDDQLYSYHGFSDEFGEVLVWFGGRKVRTYPRHTGFSSFLELTRDEALLHAGWAAARGLGLKGVFKIDFKRDPRDGRFLALEVNARYNLWHHLGGVNGLSIPRVAYDYLVNGIRATSQTYHTRYHWLDFGLDCRAYLEQRRSGGPGLAAWLGSLLRARKVYHVFSWRDPLPAGKRWLSRLGERLGWRSTAS